MVASLDELRAAARKACDDPRLRRALWRHCRYVDAAKPESLDTRVHPGDQMLDHSLRHFGNANFAVSQYFNVALQQHNSAQQVLRHAFPDDWSDRSVLDFACGFGRHLRLLTLAVPAANVWASEIQRDALEFVAERFGVHAIPSGPEPTAFDPGCRFDFIWVASLFSHLPDALFRGWLAALLRLLTPDGLLCFSVHDERELSDARLMTPAGIYFHPGSEIPELDLAVYGTSFVSPRYVDAAIGDAGGTGNSRLRIPRGIAGQQDLFVVSSRNERLATLPFRKGPWGWVDKIRFAAGALRIEGWAGSLDEGAIGEVQIRLDGESFRCPTNLSRGDVRPVVGDDRCGFVFVGSPGTELEFAL